MKSLRGSKEDPRNERDEVGEGIVKKEKIYPSRIALI